MVVVKQGCKANVECDVVHKTINSTTKTAVLFLLEKGL